MKTYVELYKEFIGVKNSNDFEGLQTIIKKKIKDSADKCGDEVNSVVKTLCFGIAKADGILSPDELGMARLFAKDNNLDVKDVIDELKATTEEDVAAAKEKFKKYPEPVKEDLIFALINIVTIDGFVDEEESSIIKDLY